MSRTLNRVQLIGRLGADPQMRYTSSGVAVTSFSVATNRQWQGKDGTQQEETDWHTVVAWDKLAQICSEHLTKGRLVYIEGRLQNRQYEHEGQTRYKTEIVASDMLILDSRGTTAGDSAQDEDAPIARTVQSPRPEPVSARSGRSGSSERTPQNIQARNSRPAVISDPDEDPDDLPF